MAKRNCSSAKGKETASQTASRCELNFLSSNPLCSGVRRTSNSFWPSLSEFYDPALKGSLEPQSFPQAFVCLVTSTFILKSSKESLLSLPPPISLFFYFPLWAQKSPTFPPSLFTLYFPHWLISSTTIGPLKSFPFSSRELFTRWSFLGRICPPSPVRICWRLCG